MSAQLCAISLLTPCLAFWVVVGATIAAGIATHWFIRERGGGKGLGWKPLALLAVVLTAGLAVSNLRARHAREKIEQMVSGLAPSYAEGMSARGFAAIHADTPADDPTYLQLIKTQRRWVELNPIVADIYAFGKNAAGEVVLLVDSETDYDHSGAIDDEREERTPIGEVYAEDGESIARAFAGERVFVSEVVEDRWGQWVSAYEPIRGDDGRVVGVLGVDYPAERWEEAASQVMWGSLAQVGVVVLGILSAAALVAINRATVERERQEARHEAELRVQAEATSKAKGEFLAHMTHELRTPMSAIQGFAGLLADDGYPAAERGEALRIIGAQCDHLLAIVGDVLDLSKVEAGRMELSKAECSLAELIADTVKVMDVRARAKGISLKAEFVYPLPATILTDSLRLRQVLNNLLSNSIKFTEQGGVTIRTTWDGEASILALEVIDTGIGMTEEQQARLFTPYVQATAGTANRYGGTGLGLTISKQLVELLGGSLSISSRPGAGTSALLTLGVSSTNLRLVHGEVERAKPVGDAVANRMGALAGRVLLAEDSLDIQRLFALLLRKAGAEVEVVEDGAVALRRIMDGVKGGKAVDLVLLDLGLPGMSGLQVIRALRAQGYAGRVAALTAASASTDRAECLAAGFDDFLSKPIGRQELIARCRALLRGPASRAA